MEVLKIANPWLLALCPKYIYNYIHTYYTIKYAITGKHLLQTWVNAIPRNLELKHVRAQICAKIALKCNAFQRQSEGGSSSA